MPTYQFENTRRFKRVQAHSLVKYQAADRWESEDPYIANVKDVSAGGVRFWSPVYLPEGTLLRVSVWMPFLEKPLEALARVVRVRTARTPDSFYLSVRFIEIDQTSQQQINSFIEKLAANSETRKFIDDFKGKIRRTGNLSGV